MKNNNEGMKNKSDHRSAVVWLTGLTGAGKSTIAYRLRDELFKHDIKTYVLDGDHLRSGLSSDLGYGKADRVEHLRRAKEVALLFQDAGFVVICAFITPFLETRKKIRASFKPGEFIEVFVDCTLEECERRDPKGLYAKFRHGEIKDFTGLTSPYERPIDSEIHLRTDQMTIDACNDAILKFLINADIIQQASFIASEE